MQGIRRASSAYMHSPGEEEQGSGDPKVLLDFDASGEPAAFLWPSDSALVIFCSQRSLCAPSPPLSLFHFFETWKGSIWFLNKSSDVDAGFLWQS